MSRSIKIGRGHPAPPIRYVVHLHVQDVGPRPRGTFADLDEARAFARMNPLGRAWRIDRVEVVERGEAVRL